MKYNKMIREKETYSHIIVSNQSNVHLAFTASVELDALLSMIKINSIKALCHSNFKWSKISATL